MTDGVTAAARAREQVAAVRDDPVGRVELLERTYGGPTGRAPRHLPFRRAALSFMHWQLDRGVLAPLTATPPGSPWWRAANERLLRDQCESVARSGGLVGAPSSDTIAVWMSFVAKPTARTWYRAHNASIVSAYLEQRDLTEGESRSERFFLNVVLLRVLFAHALVAQPSLALGWLGPLGPLVGDPRVGMTGIFLSLRRILPDRYPLDGDVAQHAGSELSFGRMLDYGIIGPRLQQIYEWSAAELDQPALLGCIRNGSPTYAWPYADRQVWDPPQVSASVRVVRRAVPPKPSVVSPRDPTTS
jgi:hypothetical protein